MALVAATADPVTLHYVRSNRDGTEAEHIYVHRAAPDRVAVYKMVERCTRAALVTATIDPATGEARRLEAARLLPGATSSVYAVMTYDPDSHRITAEITGDTAATSSVTATATPWHLYDYDLATLSIGAAVPARARADFAFGMALVWPDQARPDEFLLWLGEARARFVRTERRGRMRTLRYDVGGPAFGAVGGGPLWLDARSGHIVEARWGRPNHAENRDFALRLIGRVGGGARGWTALLTRHFAGCK